MLIQDTYKQNQFMYIERYEHTYVVQYISQ